MIEATEYRFVYYTMLWVLWLLYTTRTLAFQYGKANTGKARTRTDRSLNNISRFFVLFLVLFIGLRPIHKTFTDMIGYANEFNRHIIYNETSEFTWQFFFDTFYNLEANVHIWFLFIAACYVGLIWVTSKKIFNEKAWYPFLLFISCFFFFNYGVNILRAGVAASVVLIGLTYLIRHKMNIQTYIVYILISLIAFGTHNASILSSVCCLVGFHFKSFKYPLLIWLACCVISYNIPDDFVNMFIGLGLDGRVDTYLSTEADETLFSHVGFRWDFLLYSAAPVIFAIYVCKKYKTDEIYPKLVSSYLLANAFWVLFIRANYSDRFAYLSWFMYSLIFSYPLIKFGMNKLFSVIILLGFVIFASIIHV